MRKATTDFVFPKVGINDDFVICFLGKLLNAIVRNKIDVNKSRFSGFMNADILLINNYIFYQLPPRPALKRDTPP